MISKPQTNETHITSNRIENVLRHHGNVNNMWQQLLSLFKDDVSTDSVLVVM